MKYIIVLLLLCSCGSITKVNSIELKQPKRITTGTATFAVLTFFIGYTIGVQIKQNK